MLDWLDAMAGVTVVDVSVDILSLPWPLEISANEFQGSCSARMSRGLRIMVVSQYAKSQGVVVRDSYEAVVH